MSEVLKNRLETIIEAIELIEQRMIKIKNPSDFISNDFGILLMDGIAMRLQVIGETVKKIDQEDSSILSQYNIDPKPIIRFRDSISHH